MKKNDDLKKEIQNTLQGEPLLKTAGNRINATFSKLLKKFVYIISLAAIGLIFNGCWVGYVATEPAYVEYSRPPRPSNLYIWVDGDYAWNNQTHVYVQRAGYWERPRQNQTFVSGHWQTTAKGKSWENGHWQKETKKGSKSRR